MFVGYSSAIRFQCGQLKDDDDLLFYKRRQWETFYCLTTKNDLCSAWKGNKAAVYGDQIGSYAVAAELIVESKNDKDIEWSKKQKIFKNYRSGTILPPIQIRLLDGLGQRYATSDHDIVATMSSTTDFLADAITMTIKDGAGSFSRIAGNAPSGNHRVVIEFNDETIESLSLTVHVRQCKINEEASDDSGCDPCNDSSYNFDPQTGKCQRCPDHSNCESHMILPEPTFWHPMPCSIHVQKCLASEACKPDGWEGLKKITDGAENCSFSKKDIDNYREAQCLKVDLDRCLLPAETVRVMDYVLYRDTPVPFVDLAKSLMGILWHQLAQSARAFTQTCVSLSSPFWVFSCSPVLPCEETSMYPVNCKQKKSVHANPT